MPCGMQDTQPGILPVLPALEAQSLNYWTAREVPEREYLEAVKAYLIAVLRVILELSFKFCEQKRRLYTAHIYSIHIHKR